MRKYSRLLSVIAMLIMVLSMTIPSYASACGDTHDNDPYPLSFSNDLDTWQTFNDESTGLNLTYPSDWNLRVHSTAIDANNVNGDTVKYILLSSISGKYQIKLTQLNDKVGFQKNSFIVNDNGLNIYYAAPEQELSLIDGAMVYLSDTNGNNLEFKQAWDVINSISFK